MLEILNILITGLRRRRKVKILSVYQRAISRKPKKTEKIFRIPQRLHVRHLIENEDIVPSKARVLADFPE
jgi:hypothetical protein